MSRGKTGFHFSGSCSNRCTSITSIGGTSGLLEGNPRQLLTQFYGVAVTLAWSGGMTFILLKPVGAFVPLQVSRGQEMEGLDISQPGEALQ